ncbi:hypothetical protein KY332_01870 [Candidatus Woesearchaeota archaeon]|nr:hypothetical protein [Candidatus Woesearchaeota archaeon]
MLGKVELREVKHFDEIELRDMLNKNKLKLLIDIKKKEVHHVLSKKHHIQEALKYLGIKEKDLAKVKPSHIVSVQVIIENKVVKEVFIGGGSLEMAYHKQTGKNIHTDKQLDDALKIFNKVMKLSEQLHEVTLVKDIAKHEYKISS